MEAIYLLVPIALVFVAIAIGIFFWAVKNGQYDDLNTEARRILFDTEKVNTSQPVSQKNPSSADEKSGLTPSDKHLADRESKEGSQSKPLSK